MKRWATLAIAAGMIVIAGCGSSGSDKASPSTPTTLSKDKACGEVQAIQKETQQLTDDVAAGKVPMGPMMGKIGELAGRLGTLAGSVEPGPLKDAVTQWAAATTTQVSDPSEANQTATFDARDKVDDACGLPHGTRS